MYELKVKSHFDAAHYILDYEGKCSREHGHRWGVEVCLEGETLDARNMLIDFKDVKDVLDEEVLYWLDHHQLNKQLREENVTAEFLARWIYERLKGKFDPVELSWVAVWESPDCGVRYATS